MTRIFFGILSIAGIAAVGLAFKIGELANLKAAVSLWDVATFYAAMFLALLVGALTWEVGCALAPKERQP